MFRALIVFGFVLLGVACGDETAPPDATPTPPDADAPDAPPDNGDSEEDPDASDPPDEDDTNDATTGPDPDCACADEIDCAAVAGLSCTTQTLGFCDAGDCQAGGALTLLHAHDEGRWIQALHWSADGTRLLSVAEHPDRPDERDLRIWDIASGTLVHQVDGVLDVDVAADGRVAVGFTDAVEIWSEASATPGVERWEEVFGTVAFNPAGTVLAAEQEGGVALRNLASGELLHALDHPGREGVRLWTLAFSPDGERLLSGNGQNGLGSPAGSVRAWDTSSGEMLAEVDCATLSVAWNPEGTEASATCWNTTLRLDPETWQARETLVTSNLALAAGWSPEGTFWLGTFLGPLRIGFDGPQPSAPRLALDRMGVRAVAFHPDGDRVALGTWNDAALHLWQWP